MTRVREELKYYKHEELMKDFNDLQIRIKTYLFDIGNEDFKLKHPKPTVEELDLMMNRIMLVLEQDSWPMKQY